MNQACASKHYFQLRSFNPNDISITFRFNRSQISYAEREDVYRKDPMEKPPFNYAQIIAMAMMDQGRMTLKEICKWIQEHFAYFRYNKNWNVRAAFSLLIITFDFCRRATIDGFVRSSREHRLDSPFGRFYVVESNELGERALFQMSVSL